MKTLSSILFWVGFIFLVFSLMRFLKAVARKKSEYCIDLRDVIPFLCFIASAVAKYISM